MSAHSEVVFVVHSMGGLALRAYLTKYRNIAPKTRLVYFFSTPTTGSEIASLAALISANPLLAEMRPMRSVDYLADLQRQWLAAELGIASYCAYEKRPTYGIQVVTQASASNMCNKRLDPIDEDHVTIVKPTDMRHPSYLALKSALSQTVSSLAAAADSVRNPTTEANPNPVFPKGTVLKTAEGAALTIESELHAGAESAIFLAKARSGDNVAVKIFWKGLGPNSPAWQHFKDEQQAAKSLSHRNIIKILDTGIVGGYPFTVMEYFSGRSLKEWLEARDRMPGPDILSLATQIADAIDFAHSKGIVHRDIKPSNILIESTPQSRVVLSDFGVARVFGAIQRNITVSGNELVGSPDFLAPEAIKGQEISEKSDISSASSFDTVCRFVESIVSDSTLR